MTPEQRADFATEHGIEPTVRKKKGGAQEKRSKVDMVEYFRQHGTVKGLAARRAEQIVHNRLEAAAAFTWPRHNNGKWRPLKEKDTELVHKLLLNSLPAVKHELRTISSDGITLHITYGVAGTKGAKKAPKKKELADTTANSAEDVPAEAGIKWDGPAPPRYTRAQTVITSDPGKHEVTYVRLPERIGEAVALHAEGKLAPDDPVYADDAAAKVRGNRQLSAGVWEATARTKQQRRAEEHALALVDNELAAATQPGRPRITVAGVAATCTDLARATEEPRLWHAIAARAKAGIVMLYANFRTVFRQNRRATGLAKKRMSEQVAHSIVELAQPVVGGSLWREQRVQVEAFSETTRARQEHRDRRAAQRRARPAPLNTVVVVNGAWTAGGGGKGSGSAFPRMDLQKEVDRSLQHIAKTRNGVNALFSCRADEHRTSKQSSKLSDLLSGRRVDKRNPTYGTWATTGEKQFRIETDRPWKLMQWTGPDGIVYVSNRDEATCTNMGSCYIRSSLGKERLWTLSRSSLTSYKTTAQTGGRGGDARRTSKTRGRGSRP